MGTKNLPFWKGRFSAWFWCRWPGDCILGTPNPPRPEALILHMRSGGDSNVTQGTKLGPGLWHWRFRFLCLTHQSQYCRLSPQTHLSSLEWLPVGFFGIYLELVYHHPTTPIKFWNDQRGLGMSTFVKDSRRSRSHWCNRAHGLMVKPRVFWARSCGFGSY